MNQSLERIIFIGLNLVLLVSVGLPILFATTQILTETEQQLIYHNFIDEVDEIVRFADQNRASLSHLIHVPSNISVNAELNQLVFRFYYQSWHVTSRSYRCNITVEGPQVSGPHLILVNATDIQIYVAFQLS